MAISMKDLRARGYSDEDIGLARLTQEGQRRSGGHVQSLTTILTGRVPTNTPKAVEDLSARQLRRRGRYGQAALLADQEALAEKDPSRASKAREASGLLKELAARPSQLEFDFWGGNWMTADQYHDAIRERLMATTATPAERMTALGVLQEIKRWLGWQSFTCTKTAAELGDLLGVNKTDMSFALARLEEIGAIIRVKRGRTKVITVTPEGAFRGDVNKHAEVMDRYKAEVIPFKGAPAE